MTLTAPAEADARPPAFRADIQGLRALAVVLVVVYHTGYALPGGFIGVDVFFVLSGFLIIGLLDREAGRHGRIDLAGFFARRARRLLPALAAVTVITLLLATMTLGLGGQLATATRTATGASLFIANYLLYRGVDYFAPAAESDPFLHTWSLSVEEQFYFIVPVLLGLLLVVARRLHLSGAARRRSWVVMLTLGAVLSFGLNVALVDLDGSLPFVQESRTFAFYAPVTRAWQFFAGGLLAFLPSTERRLPRPVTELTLASGLGMILAAALLLDDAAAFPGMRALLPVLGTLLVMLPGTISAGSPARGVVTTMLATRGAVRIGDLSYSWYLWHWPAIVLTRAAVGDRAVAVSGAVLASLAVAAASQRFLEDRFRHDRALLGRRALRLTAICVAVPLGVALLISHANDRVLDRTGLGETGRPWSISGCLVAMQSDDPWSRDDCVRGTAREDPDAGVDVLLIGDSHATAMSDGVLEATERLGLSLGVWAVGGQPPVGDNVWVPRFIELIEQERPKVVVLVNRSSNNLTPRNVPRWTTDPVVDDELAELWGEAVRTSVLRYRELGPRIIWVLNVPEFTGGPDGEDSIGTLLRPQVRTRSITLEEVAERRGPATPAEIAALRGLDGVVIVEPTDALCDPDCRNAEDGVYLYSDTHHLSAHGSRKVTGLLEAALREVLADGP